MATKVRIHRVSPPAGYDTTTEGLHVPSMPQMKDRLPDFDAPRKGAALKRQAVNNIVGVSDLGTPAEHEEGRVWYPKVHDATAKGVKKHKLDSLLHGSAVVSSVSPNMDFDSSNIHAFGQMAKFMANPEHRAAHARSLANMEPDAQGKPRQKRTPEFKDILTKNYPAIRSAPDTNILKATKVWEGQDPEKVLPVTSALKTNSFMHNINDPSRTTSPHTGFPLATIDGRARDIATNSMVSWGTDRGIGAGAAKRGKMTRGEHFADAYGKAANVVGSEANREVTPSELQARTWVTGKRIERSMPGARRSTADRSVIIGGPSRKGQRYV